ncbi:MAG: redox-regulated ATPase YchF [Microcystis aeruginosa Ma_QC_Ch_20071001_S25]|jgi:GTP-binding protein YchF|uniref:Ribosome-binding ATPase YchF n=3 Tax=Microcystis aeruginosa TaxID=1126 RepID=A0A552FXH9_MICAE|nr:MULTISPECIES: redox-regulated ATPase YchF [unclassified Microcystis]MCA2765033.1 redox-regulated ATPase YchF [Microcystis sp. M151S2]MCU7245653.1 redox-regulated ATPase YchF [Microcystis aeruginosa WS75]NCQ69367.1 redox-regulated ATPase YchF [Microcystis aeruginosa W13-16]NCQ73926.1 redox-regulated ATPase YchF [Microcystis aeruginosa W13-13]NCQ78408.1 redox-regulated ATPase YchF [Microcystis aeruginosa W13-15]NCQ83457.1 redox-regulated ATPase YchF [Microcystis aeruginosa W13-18]NCR34029.1
MLKAGIVGLPNVGKSTLFNALVANAKAEAANFPFCTIEPNVGVVSVPDERLEVLAKISNSEKIVPTRIEFVDIAGLVKGASQGEGLGNQFLANIREVDAIVHVVRCFDNDDIIHVSGSVDPARDIEVINLELALADLGQVEKRVERLRKQAKNSKEAAEELAILEKILICLNDGISARKVDLSKEEEELIKNLGLLSRKPIIYAANVSEDDLATGNDWVESVRQIAQQEQAKVVIVSAQVESELVELSEEERKDFLGSLGVEEGGLKSLIKATYELLGLRTYLTTGPQETRAWTIISGMKAPQAAGVIHSDFERGFIRAETVSYQDLVNSGTMSAAKEKGLVRSEGKEYIVQEGDVLLFRFNV